MALFWGVFNSLIIFYEQKKTKFFVLEIKQRKLVPTLLEEVQNQVMANFDIIVLYQRFFNFPVVFEFSMVS